MTAEQKWKLGAWCLLYVVLPLLVYVMVLFAAAATGAGYGLEQVLVDGDLLFFAVILLATTLDFTITDLRLTPARQANLEWRNPIWALILILFLVVTSYVCGLQVYARLDRLSGGVGIQNPAVVLWFCALWVPTVTVLCFGQYLYLLKRSRI